MAKFDLLYTQEFTSTDTIVITHNLNRRVFNIRLITTDEVGSTLASESQRQLVEDIVLDTNDPLNKMTVTLTASRTGKVQLIAEDTIQSPYYTVEEKLASQAETPLAGTAPTKFEYGGNANSGRILEYVTFDNSIDAPFIVIADGKLRGVVVGAVAAPGGDRDVGVYKIGSPDVLLYTATLSGGSTQEIDASIDVDLDAGDKIYVKVLTSSISKPYVVIYTQTI